MAKKKYSIIDENNENMGFVVVETPTAFQHSQPTAIIPSEGPISDAILFITVLGGITFTLWVGGADGLYAAVCGVTITSLLAGIKARYGQIIPEFENTAQAVVRGEFKANDGTLHFDEINNPKILMKSLIKVCRVVMKNNFVWRGRGAMKLHAGVGRSQYELIRSEFYKLNYFKDGEAGKVEMSGRGRLFVRKVAELRK